MATQVFISYSHRDQRFFNDFLKKHLRPLIGDLPIDIWTDQRLQATDDWDREIQSALSSARVAVLLVSPDFLSSEYIQEREVGPLLQAERDKRVRITCLYLKPSVATDPDCWLNRATQLQGLNDPAKPIERLRGDQRNQAYADAAVKLKNLLKPGGTRPQRFDDDHRELVIRLSRSGSQLIRFYLNENTVIPQCHSDWHPFGVAEANGRALYQTLFGPPERDHTNTVLQWIFNLTSDIAPSPSRHPVRVRIQTEDPLLASLPWQLTSHDDKPLVEEGWTFELISAEADSTTVSFRSATLRAPCPVLMIAPDLPGGPDIDETLCRRAFEECLDRVWKFRDKLWFARTRQQLKDVFAQTRPRIIYYLGAADNNAGGLILHLGNSAESTEPCSLSDLASLWQRTPPELVFLNLITDKPEAVGTSAACLTPSVPLVVTQTARTVELSEAHGCALAWFNDLLSSGPRPDPIAALNRKALPSAIAWTAYSDWKTQTANEPLREQLVRLLLDRKLQRSQVLKVVNELVRDSERRVCCVFAYGCEGNMIDRFTDQLLEFLRRNAREIAHVRRVSFPFLPPRSGFNIEQLRERVIRGLGLDLSSTNTLDTALSKALAKRKPRALDRAQPVLLLDWGVRGTTKKAALEAWLKFCFEHLCRACPRDMRLLVCLCLERPKEAHDTIKVEVRKLHNRYVSKQFHLERLEPLDDIEEDELLEFLRSRHSSFPEDDPLLRDLPFLIQQKTGGRFEETVKLLEQADKESWILLGDKLRKTVSSSSDEDDGDLDL